MELSYDLRTKLADELRYIAAELEGQQTMAYKNYIFSGAHAMTNRILNLAYSEELVLLHSILVTAHTGIQTRLSPLASGQEKVVSVPGHIFNALAKALKELADAVEAEEPLWGPLLKIAVAGYITTGNGYYLLKKGILELEI